MPLLRKCLALILMLLTGLWAQDFTPSNSPEIEISNAWQTRLKAIQANNPSIASKQLELIQNISKKYIFSSVSLVGLGLIEEMKNAQIIDTGKDDFVAMQTFMPDHPSVDFLLCKKGFGFIQIQHCLEGLSKSLSNMGSLLGLLSNISTILMVSLGMLFLFYLLFLTLEHGQYFSAFYAQFFPKLPKCISMLLHFILMLASYMAMGWMGVGLYTLLTLSPKMTVGNNVVVLLFGLVFLALPYVFYIHAFKANHRNDIANIMLDPFDGSYINQNEIILEKWMKKFPKDHQAAFTLARVKTRLKKFNESKNMYESLIRENPNWIKPKINLAIMHFVLDDKPNAQKMFEDLADGSTNALKAHFNLAQIYLSKTQIEQGAKQIAQAKEINPKKYSITTLESKQNNSDEFLKSLVEESLEPREIWPRFLHVKESSKAIQKSLFKNAFSGLSVTFYQLFVLLLIASRVFLLFKQPQKTHVVRSAQSSDESDLNVFKQFGKKPFLFGLFLDENIEAFKVRWISLLIPGAHWYFKGHVLLSFLIVFLFLLFVTPLFFSCLLFKDPIESHGLPSLNVSLMLGLLATFIYGWIIYVVVKKRN